MKYSRIRRLRVALAIGIIGLHFYGIRAVAQPFSFSAKNTELTRLSYGSIAIADVDHDGDFDVLYTGNAHAIRPYEALSGVAINTSEDLEGFGTVPFDATRLSTETWLGSASWADYDLDGDLDFALTGTDSERGPYLSISLLYRNDGAGNFSPVDAGMTGVHASTTQWIDFDNDGDADLTLMGRRSDGSHALLLYRNDGNDQFVQISTPFPQLAFGDVSWADFDSDGDHDVLITGTTEDGQFLTSLFRNERDGLFTNTSNGFASVAFSVAAWGDYDSDGDLDLVLSGAELGIEEPFVGRTILYRNDGGNFVEVSDDFLGVYTGDLAWADYDLDGDLDLYVMGRTSMLANHVGYIYQNNDGEFRVVTGLVGTSTVNSEWVDFDGDNDVDVLVSGINLAAAPFTKMYRNDSRLINTRPLPPVGLSASVGPGSATMSWSPGSDVHTVPTGLSYNLRVGSAPGAADVMTALASSETGRRWMSGMGNVAQNTSWTLEGLPVGLYYWSVQSVDNSYIGSPFAAEAQFTVSTGGKVSTASDQSSILPSEIRLNEVYPNPFTESATFSFEIPHTSRVTLSVYDVLGKRVKMLVDKAYPAGRHTIIWSGESEGGSKVGSGVYFTRMEADGTNRIQEVVVVR